MPGRRTSRARRVAVAAVLTALACVPALAGAAAGEETLTELEARMHELQEELDDATARIERLRDAKDHLSARIDVIERRRSELARVVARLRTRVVERADALYRAGGAGMLEALMGSGSLADVSQRAEYLGVVARLDEAAFTKLARSERSLDTLAAELGERRAALTATTGELLDESDALQRRFDEVAAEYEELKRRIAAARAAARRAAAAAAADAADDDDEVAAPAAAPAPAPAPPPGRGLVCPVAGPVSFVDSWGAPRDGHTHQGVDMMAAYGTPLVAITSGTISYAAYDGSGGNMIFLDGDDGHSYWYMHNQRNLVTGGRVQRGQQIATVGDTGNAAGTPHLHFEYHPGGGGPVNPYPLVASIC